MRRVYSVITNASWGLLVALLPITSLPLLSRVMGGTDVAPVSALFLAILVVIWLIPAILRGKTLPLQTVPLLVFFCLALISSSLAFFLPLPNFKNVPLLANELPNILTLGLGICFYLAISMWITDEGKLHAFFRIVNISGAAMLAYCLVQFVFVIVLGRVPGVMMGVQNLLVASETTFYGRLNGLAFEPSWLAHQLNMFYIPIWLGLTIKKISFHKLRIFKISLENILLAVAFFVLIFSKSRIGWLGSLGYLTFLFLRLMNTVRQRLFHRHSSTEAQGLHKRNPLFDLAFWLGLMILLAGVVLAAGWALTKIDPKRMADLFDLQTLQQLGFLAWASRIQLAERIVYWMAGFSIFLMYPIFGVGLGNAGYLIPRVMNNFGFKLPEVLRIYLSNAFLPNAKNLWTRLLAETGIAGFAVFISWMWVGWKTARETEQSESRIAKAVGIIGQIAIISLIFEGFSLDTFALPYYWMILGLVVAANRLFVSRPITDAVEIQEASPA